MWLNFVNTALNFFLQGVGSRGLAGINLDFKNPKEKSPTVLNRMIWAADSDHQNGKLHEQEITIIV